MVRAFLFLIFFFVTGVALSQTPILRVNPANSVGMVVTVTFPPSPSAIDYELFYRVQGIGTYMSEATFSVPPSTGNTLGSHIISVTGLSLTDMYEFKLEEVGNPSNQTVVLQSFTEEWCSSSTDILHSFNHPISGHTGTPSYPHEGLDVMGGGSPVYAPRGGWIIQVSGTGGNQQVAIAMYNTSYSGSLSSPPTSAYDLVEFNHITVDPVISGGVADQKSVYPGQLIGHIGTTFPSGYENHVHVGYYINGNSVPQTNWRNPLEMFQEPENRDPGQTPPQLFDVDGNLEKFQFCENLLSSGSGSLTYFPNPLNQGTPVQVWGGVDFAVEAVDYQTGSTAPFAIPYEIGYQVEREVTSGQWDNVVAPYKLFKSDMWLPVGSCANPTADCPSFIEALVDQDIHDAFGWREYYAFIPTNTKGTSGSGFDISQNDCWATDARDDETTANGFSQNASNVPDYNKARCVEEAKFPDGKYKAVVTMADLVNPSVEEDKEVIVDNFKPYVQQVRIATGQSPSSFSGAEMIYEGTREWDANAVELNLVPFNGCCGSNSRVLGTANPFYDDVYIEVTFSEPMDETSLPIVSIPTLGNYDAVWQSTSADGKTFDYFIPSSQLEQFASVDEHGLVITGSDISGNGLTGFDETPESISDNQIPKRTGASSWSSNYGLPADVTHEFHLLTPCVPFQSPPAGGGSLFSVLATSCVFTDFEADVLVGEAPLEVEFTDLTLSSFPLSYWLWSFGDGGAQSYTFDPASPVSPSNPVPPGVTIDNVEGDALTHTYVNPGTYTVSLTVVDDAGENGPATFEWTVS